MSKKAYRIARKTLVNKAQDRKNVLMLQNQAHQKQQARYAAILAKQKDTPRPSEKPPNPRKKAVK